MTNRAAFDAWLDKRAYYTYNQRTAARDAWEACAAILDKWSNASYLKLHAGEMTAQELRTAQAVVAGIKADIGGAK